MKKTKAKVRKCSNCGTIIEDKKIKRCFNCGTLIKEKKTKAKKVKTYEKD